MSDVAHPNDSAVHRLDRQVLELPRRVESSNARLSLLPVGNPVTPEAQVADAAKEAAKKIDAGVGRAESVKTWSMGCHRGRTYTALHA